MKIYECFLAILEKQKGRKPYAEAVEALVQLVDDALKQVAAEPVILEGKKDITFLVRDPLKKVVALELAGYLSMIGLSTKDVEKLLEWSKVPSSKKLAAFTNQPLVVAVEDQFGNFDSVILYWKDPKGACELHLMLLSRNGEVADVWIKN